MCTKYNNKQNMIKNNLFYVHSYIFALIFPFFIGRKIIRIWEHSWSNKTSYFLPIQTNVYKGFHEKIIRLF